MLFAIDRARSTMAWKMIPQKHSLKNVFRAFGSRRRARLLKYGIATLNMTQTVASF